MYYSDCGRAAIWIIVAEPQAVERDTGRGLAMYGVGVADANVVIRVVEVKLVSSLVGV